MFCTNWIVEFKILPFGVSHSRYLVLMVLAFKGVDANHHCSWCRNFSCVPSSHWNCDGENNNRANCKVHAYYSFTFENVEFTIFPNLHVPKYMKQDIMIKHQCDAHDKKKGKVQEKIKDLLNSKFYPYI